MNRDEFCKYHWEYYLVLENDFIGTERYVSFELGDNYLYDGRTNVESGNSMTFSNEFIKQYQAICSEVDVILKSICKELNNPSANNMKSGYTPTILNQWSAIPTQRVKFKDIELQPFANWKQEPYQSPDWWAPYNDVKHERVDNYRSANLKNVVNALAGLYVLEKYFVKYIGDRDHDMDVPNNVSRIFEMISFDTRDTVVGKDFYLSSTQDIADMLGDN